MRSLRDPAPSRLAYRLNRLMLTPAFRTFLRYGLPVLIVAAGIAFWASDEARRTSAFENYADLKRQIQERPEFMVNMMSIEHASERVATDVRSRLPIDFPLSSFDLDLEAIRAEVEKVTAVRSASVHIRAGVLNIEVSERIPVVIWRSQDGLSLLDETGTETARIEARSDRSDLPLIVGTQAGESVPEALELFAAADPIRDRMRGLQRVGARRWDVVLDRDQRIMLPETDPVTVFEKVIALDAAQDLLSRDVARIDFRNPRRPVLRLTATAIDSMFNSQLTQTKDQAE